MHLRRSVRGGFGPERVLGGFQDFMDIMASFDPAEEKLEGANDETRDGSTGTSEEDVGEEERDELMVRTERYGTG